MKKGFFLSLIIAPLLMIAVYTPGKVQEAGTFVSNEELETVAGIENWQGTPLDSKGRYVNLYQPFESSFKDLLKWQLSKNPQKTEKENDYREPPVTNQKLDFNTKEDFLIWLGHASFLMRLDGVTLLTDPVLIDNTFLKLRHALPYDLLEIPQLDYILLSHAHRDHCDKATLSFLFEQHPNVRILTGLGIGEVIGDWRSHSKQTITEAGWFQRFPLKNKDLEITYLPARHWSRRGLLDENKTLWGGFYIKSTSKSIFFMGDSGYDAHFKLIADALGAPDYAIMGVGAYKPEWFMAQAHISPLDAIKAFNEMGAKTFIPMHYGTFDLSDEPSLEPWDVLWEHKKTIQGKLEEGILGRNYFHYDKTERFF